MESETSFIIVADASDAGARLDAFLAGKIEGWSRSRLQRLIEDGDVLVNGKEAKPSYKVREGDEIDIDLTEEPVARFEPENIPLDIVFEDNFLAVINKPAGMIVHPGAGVSSGTLVNAIAWHFAAERADGRSVPPALAGGRVSKQNGVDFALGAAPPADAGGTDLQPPEGGTPNRDRVGIVHRLDKDTSGLIVVAKDEQTQDALSKQFHDRTVYKSYVALVHGSPRENSGKIDRPIARDRWHRTKMTVAANGRHALSIWKVRKRFEKFTLLDVEIKTGRTHQIRVHLASINHPVVGDAVYNEGRDNTIADADIKRAVTSLNRFFLHAERLAFTHPSSGERMEFSQEIPAELDDLLKKF